MDIGHLWNSIGTFAQDISSLAIITGLFGNLLVVLSPRLSARITSWWAKRKAMVAQALTTSATTPPAARPPTTAPSTIGSGYLSGAATNAGPRSPMASPGAPAVLGAPPPAPGAPPIPSALPESPVSTPFAGVSPTSPPYQLPAAPSVPGAAGDSPGQMGQFAPWMPIPAPQPAPTVRAPSTTPIAARLHAFTPSYPRLWRFEIALFVLLIVGGIVTGTSSSDSSSPIFQLGVSTLVVCGIMLYVLTLWALTMAIRLSKGGWIAGMAAAALSLYGAVFAPLIFAVKGPTVAPGMPVIRFPRMFWATAIVTAVTALGAVLLIVSSVAAAAAVEAASDPSAPLPDSYFTALTIGLVLGILGYLISVGFAVWALAVAIARRSWGWSIAVLLLSAGGIFVLVPWLGVLLFTLNGPAPRPAAAQVPQPTSISVRR